MTEKVKFKPNKDVYRVNLSPREATLVYSLLSLIRVDTVPSNLTSQNGALDLDAKIAQNLCLSMGEVVRTHHEAMPKVKFLVSTYDEKDLLVGAQEFETTKFQDIAIKFS